jgi:hypothetical protein
VNKIGFGPGAILEFDDNYYQVRVTGEPYQDGNLWVYTVVVADGQAASYIPTKLLLPGKQLSRLHSAYEEYSEEADILNYKTYFSMRNFLMTSRISADITGTAAEEKMWVQIHDPETNKSTYLWGDLMEWEAVSEWYKRGERMGVYSRSNRNADGTTSLKGTNGRPVYIPAGILQQIAPSNRRYYTHFSIEMLEDTLEDLSYNILGMNERKFFIFTGSEGLKKADRAMKEKASAYTLIDTKFVTGNGQQLALGGQFVTYRGINGIEATFVYFPMYDDSVHNRTLDPLTGKPVESSRMTIMAARDTNGQNNVVKVVRKNREMLMWYTGGSVGPQGGNKSFRTLASNAKDGYTIHILGDYGYFLRDPRLAAELIYAVED